MSESIDDYLNHISPKLLKFIRDSNMVVSGSTALYYYMKLQGLEPGFNPDDVDIYLSKKDFDKKEFSKCIQKIVPDYYNHNNYNFCLLHSDDKKKSEITYNHYIKFIYGIFTIGKEKTILQFIILNDDNSKTCIDSFDFGFNRVYYDGVAFFTKCHENIMQKKCVLKTLYTSITVINTVSFYLDYLKQIKKFCDSNDLKRLLRYTIQDHCDPCRILRRIRKYKQRGFTIEFDIQIDFYTLYHIQLKTLYLLTSENYKRLQDKDYIDEFFKKLISEPILSSVAMLKMTPSYHIFQSQIQWELIEKAMHPSRILNFIEL